MQRNNNNNRTFHNDVINVVVVVVDDNIQLGIQVFQNFLTTPALDKQPRVIEKGH